VIYIVERIWVRSRPTSGAARSDVSLPGEHSFLAQPTAARAPAVTWGRNSSLDICGRVNTSSSHHDLLSESEISGLEMVANEKAADQWPIHVGELTAGQFDVD
jgi:hypothetical protein